MPVNYISFPQTETPIDFYNQIIQAFNNHFDQISSEDLE